MHIAWLVVGVLLMAIALFAGYLDQHDFFYHVRLARVLSGEWPDQQVKSCASWNSKAEQPTLECDNGHSESQETAPVRFYGDTQRPLDPETVRFYWACQKKGTSKPSISCHAAPAP